MSQITFSYVMLGIMKISQTVDNNPALILLKATVQQGPAPVNSRVSSDFVHISSQARVLQSLFNRG